MVLPWPILTINGKYSSHGLVIRASDSLWIKVWVTLPGNSPTLAEVLAKGKRRTSISHDFKTKCSN